MPPFKEDQILVIAPGSRTTLAQLGIPESLTPAAHHIRSCMFAAEKPGEFEPRKIRPKPAPKKDPVATDNPISAANAADNTAPSVTEYEEDLTSEVDAIWPIVSGQIVDWPCFYALMTFVYNTINPPFHTAVLLIAEPVWTARELEKITQFFFEKFKIPAFVILDAAMATSYAYRLPNATVIDVGLDKADVTAISDHLIHTTGRTLALPDCGGNSMTHTLQKLLAHSKFSYAMCEQLKKSSICEVLPADDLVDSNSAAAAAASAKANTIGDKPLTQNGGPRGEADDGVLDIASLVTSGNMNEYLEQKEREKAERAAAKAQKKGAGESTAVAPKPVKLANNAKRQKNTFSYHDHALEDALRDMNVDGQGMADMQSAINNSDENGADSATSNGPLTREIEVGLERFQAVSGGILNRLADAVHRTISSIEEVHKRNDLWSSLVIVGNGSKVRGFKEALVANIQAKYLISPSSATMFTSEIPSNLSTPMATGMNTPQPQSMSMQHHSQSQVNPMLLAATTAQNPYSIGASSMAPSHTHASHSQAPTSIDVAKIPEYFPEWKDLGYEEAAFLGAQVAVKVIFSGGDAGPNKGYMTRTDYNEQGPQAIHDYYF